MDITKKSKSGLFNFFTVLVGALLMGLLWRARGETGWGSSWGLLNAGFIFSFFIIVITGSRKKMNLGWTALTAISFMLTVPSWGTLLYQITGILYREEFWAKGVTDYVAISPVSAVILMLSLGFGMATLFGIMLGRGYSDKQWKIKDFVIIIAAFYIVDLVTKATVSHWILNLIQPQAAEIFADGLKKAEINDTVYHAYMQHFDSLAWAKKFDGGRNYFSSIQAISSVFRSVAAILCTRFVAKDKVAAKTGLVTSLAFAFSITVADIIFYLDDGGYHMANESYLPKWFSAWSDWEYFTGFIAGAILTAFIIKLKKDTDVPEIAFSKLSDKATNILTFIIGYVFLIGANAVRPILERTKDTDVQIPCTIVMTIITVIMVILLIRKFGFDSVNLDMQSFAKLVLPCFVSYIFLAYMAIGDELHMNYKTVGECPNMFVLISYIAVVAWCIIANVKLKAKNK